MKQPLQVIPDTPERDCSNCAGACCRYVKIFVGHNHSADHVRWMETRGSLVDGFWHIRSECEHLTPCGKCGIYETRPEVCRDFEVGGVHCLDARRAYYDRSQDDGDNGEKNKKG